MTRVDIRNHLVSELLIRTLGTAQFVGTRPTMPRGRRKTTGRTVKPAGVTFEPGVLEYLEYLRGTEERSRSWLINRMVKDHAARAGLDIATFVESNVQPAGQ